MLVVLPMALYTMLPLQQQQQQQQADDHQRPPTHTAGRTALQAALRQCQIWSIKSWRLPLAAGAALCLPELEIFT
jgi:hypothetical protein